MCAGLWVISGGINLSLLVLSFISVLLFQRSGHFCLFLTFYYMCVCVFSAFILQMFSAIPCGRIFGLRFPRDLGNPLQVLFGMLRWQAEHPVLPPSIILLLTTDGGLGHENMAWQFFLLLRFTFLYICVI